MPRVILSALALLASLLAACGGEAPPALVMVTDSAGIEVVTNQPGSVEAAATWSLSREPVVDIGSGVAPEHPLYRVLSIDPMSDERVAVLTGGAEPGHVFRHDGEQLAVLGAIGDGPGEFSVDPGSILHIEPDSVAIWDAGRRRMSIFTDDGRFQREMNLAEIAPRTPLMAGNVFEAASFSHLLPSGPEHWILFKVAAFGSHTEGPSRISDTSHRLAHDGSVVATYGPFPGLELFSSPLTGIAPYPYGRSSFATTLDTHFVVGTGVDTSFRVYDEEAMLVRDVRWPDTRGSFGGPLVEQFETWMAGQLAERDPSEAEVLQGFLDEMPPPLTFPPYDGIISSDDGEVWVGDYAGQRGLIMFASEVPRMPARRYLVFDSTGAMIATVATPLGFIAHTIEGDLVWGVHRDELHVESVRAYRLARDAG